MPVKTEKMKKDEIDALYRRIQPLSLRETRPDYTWWQIKLKECTVTAYTSGKVVFQGKDLSWLEPEESSPAKKRHSSGKQPAGKKPEARPSALSRTFPMAGSDEVGTGDYFGPVVVAGVIVENEEIARQLKEMGITDSKAMTDPVIRRLAGQIQNMCPHSICILNNTKYNIVHRTRNMNAIKAMLHNQVYLNLERKGHELPALCIVDQFCAPKTYFEHLKGVEHVVRNLHFETRAESHYIAVAAASVLARNAFLETWDRMEAAAGMKLEKGGGTSVDTCAAEFLETHDLQDLYSYAKVHFANTQKALNLYNRKHPEAPLENPEADPTLF